MIDPLTTNGTPGAALCSYGRLRSAAESRSVAIRPDGDVVAVRLTGTTQVWHPTTTPLRDDTQLRLVSEVVAAAPSLPTTGRTDPRAAFAAHSTGRIGAGAASLSSAAPSGNAGIPPAGHERGLGVAGAFGRPSDLSLALRATRLPHADVEDVVCAVCGRRTHFDARTLDGRAGHGACLVGLVGR